MTLPNERLRAMRFARDFLLALLVPCETPRVPRKIREWALRVLRHYPHYHELDMLGEGEVGLFKELKKP